MKEEKWFERRVVITTSPYVSNLAPSITDRKLSFVPRPFLPSTLSLDLWLLFALSLSLHIYMPFYTSFPSLELSHSFCLSLFSLFRSLLLSINLFLSISIVQSIYLSFYLSLKFYQSISHSLFPLFTSICHFLHLYVFLSYPKKTVNVCVCVSLTEVKDGLKKIGWV